MIDSGDKSELNEKWSPTIQDDGNLGQKALNFTKGTLSFVGTGPHTRNMQVFVTLSDLTGKMGKNPWETPIGRVAEEDLPILDTCLSVSASWWSRPRKWLNGSGRMCILYNVIWFDRISIY